MEVYRCVHIYNYMYNIYMIWYIYILPDVFFFFGFAEETRAEEVDCPSLFLALCLGIEASKPQLIRVGPAELLAEEARNHISCRNIGSLLCTLECVYIYNPGCNFLYRIEGVGTPKTFDSGEPVWNPTVLQNQGPWAGNHPRTTNFDHFWTVSW